jgi:hypothetical protein
LEHQEHHKLQELQVHQEPQVHQVYHQHQVQVVSVEVYSQTNLTTWYTQLTVQQFNQHLSYTQTLQIVD